MMEGDISKLPKWAQHEIQKLRADQEWFKDAAQQVQGEVDSPIQWSMTGFHDIGEAQPLPAKSRVSFNIPKSRHAITVSYDPRTGDLEINGSEGLRLELGASNCFTIWSRRES